MRRILQTVLLILALQTLTVSAQPIGQPVAAASAPAIVSAVQSSESLELGASKQQVKLLETQLAEVRKYQDAILATVYWALGGIFVVVGLLLGFGWFANFKVYERDKDSLKAEVLSNVAKASSDLSAQTSRSATEIQ
jgi:hypothetical protein